MVKLSSKIQIVWQVRVARGEEDSLPSWFNTFRVLPASEVWACNGEWVTQVNPTLGPGIKDRFQVPKP